MPFYVVQNTASQVVSDLPQMSFEELQKFLSDNPVYQQVLTPPAYVKVN